MPASEAELVKQAVMGNTRALTALLERVGPEVRRRIAPAIPSRWRPMVSLEDLMQETYIDAFLDVHRFHMRGDNSFLSWLMTIARRNLVDALRMLEADKPRAGRSAGGPKRRGPHCFRGAPGLDAHHTQPACRPERESPASGARPGATARNLSHGHLPVRSPGKIRQRSRGGAPTQSGRSLHVAEPCSSAAFREPRHRIALPQ